MATQLSVLLDGYQYNYLQTVIKEKINTDVIRFMINNTTVSSNLMMRLTKHIEIFDI